MGRAYCRAMTNYPLEWGWHTSTSPGSVEGRSRTTLLGRQSGDDNTDVAAAGDLWCEACPNRGTWGTTAMYGINGVKMCRDCAVKARKIEHLPGRQQNEILEQDEPE